MNALTAQIFVALVLASISILYESSMPMTQNGFIVY